FDLIVTNPDPIIIDDFEAAGWTGTLAGFVRSWDGLLIPDSTLAASAATKSQLFEQFVPTPVATSTYKSSPLDAGFNSTLRVFANTTAALGRGQSGTLTPALAIDTWLDGASDPNSFVSWTVGELSFRFLRGEVSLANTAGAVGYLSQFEIVADQTASVVDGQNNQIVSAGGTAITFDREFHTPPSVIVTVVGASALFASASAI